MAETKSRFAQLPSVKDITQFIYTDITVLYRTTFV